MGTTCATTGLRVSEVLGLKWEDINFQTGQADVLRSVVDGEAAPLQDGSLTATCTSRRNDNG